jgi:flagellar basal body-associated protein FliL
LLEELAVHTTNLKNLTLQLCTRSQKQKAKTENHSNRFKKDSLTELNASLDSIKSDRKYMTV